MVNREAFVDRQKLSNRVARRFYTTSGEEVTGYDCRNPEGELYEGQWWVPTMRTTLTEGQHVFLTRIEGLEHGLNGLLRQRTEIERAIRRLEREIEGEEKGK